MSSELLSGRAVVITGAGRGLGRAFAIAAARAGAAIVVNDIDLDEANSVVAEIEAGGGRGLASGASVADPGQAAELIESCVETFGRIDGLVNNAIAYTHFGPAWEESAEQIRKAIDVGILGTLYCGAHAMRHMTEQRSGSIVNLTSRSALGVAAQSTYSTIKGAAMSTTFSWALEMLPYGVRVNALSPGAYTRAHDYAAAAGTYRPTNAVNAVSPDLVAPAAVYLLSDLSARITGQVVLMLGPRLGLTRHPRVVEHIEERESWTPEEIAETIERVFASELQPIGVEATSYQLDAQLA